MLTRFDFYMLFRHFLFWILFWNWYFVFNIHLHNLRRPILFRIDLPLVSSNCFWNIFKNSNHRSCNFFFVKHLHHLHSHFLYHYSPYLPGRNYLVFPFDFLTCCFTSIISMYYLSVFKCCDFPSVYDFYLILILEPIILYLPILISILYFFSILFILKNQESLLLNWITISLFYNKKYFEFGEMCTYWFIQWGCKTFWLIFLL